MGLMVVLQVDGKIKEGIELNALSSRVDILMRVQRGLQRHLVLMIRPETL